MFSKEKSKWFLGGTAVITFVLLFFSFGLVKNIGLLQARLLKTREPVTPIGFTDIKYVENNQMKERREMNTYTLYRSEVSCPTGYKIISGHCDPQHSLWLYPTNAYLDPATNKYECEFASESVADAVVVSRAVCVR